MCADAPMAQCDYSAEHCDNSVIMEVPESPSNASHSQHPCVINTRYVCKNADYTT